ncbi:MAG: hypothetical protein ABI895_12230 [Deltaproteobacteria bacterium]
MEDHTEMDKPALEVPAQTDYYDRLLTANAQHYYAITRILVDALPMVMRNVPPTHAELREADGILQADPATRTVCNRILGMRSACVDVTASLLEIEIGEAQQLLDIYCGCVDAGRLPTNSFDRWLVETAELAQSVLGSSH